jgi:D-sedoheptulose 7-phosphate isomerase
MSEFSAWTNDKGFEYVFSEWLSESHFCQKDAVFILSVGGGTQTISQNLVGAMHYAKERGGQVFGIVSRDGGMTRKMADVSILVPVISDERITPHAEEWQAVLWHMMTAILGKKNDSPVASAEESVVPAAFGSVSMTQ